MSENDGISLFSVSHPINKQLEKSYYEEWIFELQCQKAELLAELKIAREWMNQIHGRMLIPSIPNEDGITERMEFERTKEDKARIDELIARVGNE